MTYAYKMIGSPVGDLKLVASDKGLAAVLWAADNPRRVRLSPTVEMPDHPVLKAAEKQLDDYFAGRRKVFDLALDFVGTDFQKKVWEALVRIPFGETKTYGEIARDIGQPNAVRAVGSAANKNPIAIIAPCHRVVGASGKLTGFAGGLPAKVKLLAVEGRHYDEDPSRSSTELTNASPRKRRSSAPVAAAPLFAGT